MKIDSLRLQDFRNYGDKTFTFTEDKVFIFGPNGQGKTNILEALVVLSLGKSWRETKASDLIRKGEVSAKIEALIRESGISKVRTHRKMEALIQPRTRSFSQEGKKVSTKDWIGRIPTLLFCPEFLRLFTGSKNDRLAYLDRFVCQIDPIFRDQLIKAVKAHKQKTALLKQLEEASLETWEAQIKPWNLMLARTLPQIWERRRDVLARLQPYLEKAYQDMASSDEGVALAFLPQEDLEWTQEGCLGHFVSQAPRERASRRNSLSPLRDDVGFYLRDQLVAQSASRGEERSMMLALLSAQKELLIHEYQIHPTLLLDDVFSELDGDRQGHLEKLCEGVQTFFTTTHQEHVEGFGGEIQKIKL